MILVQLYPQLLMIIVLKQFVDYHDDHHAKALFANTSMDVPNPGSIGIVGLWMLLPLCCLFIIVI